MWENSLPDENADPPNKIGEQGINAKCPVKKGHPLNPAIQNNWNKMTHVGFGTYSSLKAISFLSLMKGAGGNPSVPFLCAQRGKEGK